MLPVACPLTSGGSRSPESQRRAGGDARGDGRGDFRGLAKIPLRQLLENLAGGFD